MLTDYCIAKFETVNLCDSFIHLLLSVWPANKVAVLIIAKPTSFKGVMFDSFYLCSCHFTWQSGFGKNLTYSFNISQWLFENAANHVK